MDRLLMDETTTGTLPGSLRISVSTPLSVPKTEGQTHETTSSSRSVVPEWSNERPRVEIYREEWKDQRPVIQFL